MTRHLMRAVPAIAERLAGHEDRVEAVLRSRWDEARAARPSVRLAAEAWVRALANGLDPDHGVEQMLDRLGKLHTGDVYLAQACATGDTAALAAFETTCRDAIEGSLRAMGLADHVIADIGQDVRRKLLVTGDGGPRIATYSGRAALRTWTRTVATREAVGRMRKRSEVVADEDLLAALPALDDGPEAHHFRERYRDELKQAFEEAMASLTAQQRNVLRHHYIDELTIDEIGALYAVHRTTAFRWLESARATLARRTQHAFQRRIHATPSEMQSIVRLLESNVELSLRRVLAE